MRVEHRVHAREIDVEVPVHEDVAKAGNGAKARSDVGWQGSEPRERVDRGGVVGGVHRRRGGEVRRDVERVLGAELQAALHRPRFVEIAAEAIDRFAGVTRELSDGALEGEEVAPDDRRVEAPRAAEPYNLTSLAKLSAFTNRNNREASHMETWHLLAPCFGP